MSNNVKVSPISASNSSSRGKKNNNNNNMMKKAAMEMETASSTSANSATIKKPIGLQNMGNTCYMNATLQCLARTKTFLSKLESYADEYGLKLQSNGDENDIEIVRVPLVKTGSGAIGGDGLSSNEENATSSLLGDFENGSGDSILKSLEGGSSQDTEESESENNELQNEIKEQILHDLKETPIIINMKIPTNSMHNHLKHTLSVLIRENKEGIEDQEDYTSGFGMNTYSTGRNSFRPDGVQEKLSKYFRLGLQHDSHEFLRTLLDGVKKEHIKSFRLSIMNNYGVVKNDKNHPKANLIKDLDRKFYHKTFVDDVFGGKLVSIQTCLTCNTIRHSYEKFLDLSLPIRVVKTSVSTSTSASISSSSTKSYNSYNDDHLDYTSNETIENCLSSFTKAELLIGPNQVECENCHKAAAASQVAVVAENNNEMIDDDNEENGKNGMDEGFSEEENSSGKSSSTPSPIPRTGEELEDDVVDDEIIEQPSSSKKQSNVFNKNKPLVKPKPPVKKIPITKSPCKRHQRIIQAPDCLTVHLKRFQISYRGYTQKVQDHVKFKFALNLTSFCEPETFDEDGEVIYSLCGFVEHGGSLHWGHYVAYVRSENQWFQISDSSYHAVQTSGVFNRDPYILFYERVRGEEKSQLLKLDQVNIVNSKASEVCSEVSYSNDNEPESESNDLCDSTTTAIDDDSTFSSKNVYEDELQMVPKEAVIALPMHIDDNPWGIDDWPAEPSSSSNSTSTSTNTITSTTMAAAYTELNNTTEESSDLPTSTSDFDHPNETVDDNREENKTVIDQDQDMDLL